MALYLKENLNFNDARIEILAEDRHDEVAFNPNERFLDLSKQDWEDLSEELFRELFQFSAISRTKLKGLRRNIAYAKKNGSRMS
jgi:epoxyqueuosine reductase QueG